MNSLNEILRPDSLIPTRRTLLKGMLTAYTASLIPFALAEPIDSKEQGAFLALSAIIAGRQSLDTGLATNLYQALIADDPTFAKGVEDLLALINEPHNFWPSQNVQGSTY